MRENGTLSYKTIGEPRDIFDTDGNPIAASASWSAQFPCLVRTITDKSNAKYVDGEYRAMSFEILIESKFDFNDEDGAVMLTRKGESLGEFRIISKEALPTVGRIRIIV